MSWDATTTGEGVIVPNLRLASFGDSLQQLGSNGELFIVYFVILFD